MRKFQRFPEPAVLKLHCVKWTNQWLEAKKQNTKSSFNWYEVDRISAREHILPVLLQQTQGHCSFCDSYPVGGVSNKTIEHFRPKSQFPELAYSWSNLYFSCDACQSTKGEKWNDLLLHADADDYLFTRYFEFDFTTGEMKPNAVANEADQLRAQVTINFYGLNSQDRQSNRRLFLRFYSRPIESDINADIWPYRDFLGL